MYLSAVVPTWQKRNSFPSMEPLSGRDPVGTCMGTIFTLYIYLYILYLFTIKYLGTVFGLEKLW